MDDQEQKVDVDIKSKNQIKNQKKKEKKKQLKQQTQQLAEQVEKEVKEAIEPMAQDDFVTELGWCIKQLRLGLLDNLNQQQADESMEVISLLESDRVPIAKKRLTMKSVFGDYRKLMKKYK